MLPTPPPNDPTQGGTPSGSEPTNPIKKKKRKSKWPHLWHNQVFTFLKLVKKRNHLIYEANMRFSSKGITALRDAQTLDHLDKVQDLLHFNISLLINKLMVFILIVSIATAAWLFHTMATTIVRFDLKVRAVKWIIDSTYDLNKSHFNYSLVSKGGGYLHLDSSHFESSDFTSGNDGPLDLKYSNGLKIEKILFPKKALVSLEMTNNKNTILSVSALEQVNSSSTLKFDISFPEGDIFDDSLKGFTHKGNADQNLPPLRARISKHLTAEEYPILLDSTTSWEWPSGLHVSDLSWEEKSNVLDNELVSSVIYGKINLLETNDSAILLSEHDVLKTKFTSPVELFLSGDSSGIYIHIEGEISKLIYGPKVMGDEKNSHMPLHIKAITDKSPYIWIILTILVSLITVVKIRPK